jgi:hypothetical protein
MWGNSLDGDKMPCTVVAGGFWGDEGKGKIISSDSFIQDGPI